VGDAAQGAEARRRAGRLSRSAEFDRVYRHGRSVSNRHFILYAFPRADSSGVRLGLSVGRKVGGAVERNRIKRLVREALAATPTPAGAHDLVVVARSEAHDLAERRGLEGVLEAIAELLAKAGLQSDAPQAVGASAPMPASEPPAAVEQERLQAPAEEL
jgi:ribonuclease P protein component